MVDVAAAVYRIYKTVVINILVKTKKKTNKKKWKRVSSEKKHEAANSQWRRTENTNLACEMKD